MLRQLSVLTVFVALGLVACSQVSRGPSQVAHESTNASVSAEPQSKTIGFARWPTAQAKSLKELAESYSTIVVGVVANSQDLTAPATPEPQDQPLGDPLPVGHPKAGLVPQPYVAGEDPPTLTGYSVRVNTVIKGSGVSPGATLKVNQAGGMLKGIAYQIEGNPVIQVGATYLFFLKDADGKALEGPPYGRFQVGVDGRLSPVDPSWAYLGAVKELDGLSVGEALLKISSATSGL